MTKDRLLLSLHQSPKTALGCLLLLKMLASINGSRQEQRNRAEILLLDILDGYETPVSLQELEKRGFEAALPCRAINEAVWKLVEEGKVQFTSTWDLEAC